MHFVGGLISRRSNKDQCKCIVIQFFPMRAPASKLRGSQHTTLPKAAFALIVTAQSLVCVCVWSPLIQDYSCNSRTFHKLYMRFSVTGCFSNGFIRDRKKTLPHCMQNRLRVQHCQYQMWSVQWKVLKAHNMNGKQIVSNSKYNSLFLRLNGVLNDIERSGFLPKM